PTLLARQGFEMVHSLNYITLINLGALPGALFAVFLSERWERKYSIVGVSLAIALFGLLYGFSFTPVAIVIFGFLAATMMDTFSALAFSYTPEQFPTDVRNSGTGLAYGVGRLANVINPFIVSAIFASYGYQAVFAYIAGAWVITAAIAASFGMKTTGRSLETISDKPPDAVVYAHSTEEVSAIVKICAATRTPIIPFGVGSSMEGHIGALQGGITI